MVNPRRQQATADREEVAFAELFSEVEEPVRKRADPPAAQQGPAPRPPSRTRRTFGPGRGKQDHLWLLAGAACALVFFLGAALVGAGSPAAPVAAPPPAEPTPTATPSPSPTPTPVPPPPTGPFRPAQVVVASLGIAAPVEPVGTASDGQMEIPADPTEVGWWSGGSLIGDPQGNTVLAGHVFNTGWGPGIFARLEAAKPGDEVAVLSADRQIARYVVTAVERLPKTEFPAQRVFASSGAHQIVLATCGNYNEATQHYQDNILVFASPAV